MADSWIPPKILPVLFFLPKNFQIWVNAGIVTCTLTSARSFARTLKGKSDLIQKQKGRTDTKDLRLWNAGAWCKVWARDAYVSLNSALLAGDVEKSRGLCTSVGWKVAFANLKELSAGYKKPSHKMKWEGDISKVKPLTWRIISIPGRGNDPGLEFCQISVEFKGVQRVRHP